MLLAVEESKKENLNLDVLLTTMTNYKKLDEDGKGENGIQTLIKYYGG